MKIDYISPGDMNMTPNQVRELQDALNAMAAETNWKHKIIVLPPCSKVFSVDDDDSDIGAMLVRQVLTGDRG